MSIFKITALVAVTSILLTSCKEETITPTSTVKTGEFVVNFDPRVGEADLVLSAANDSANFTYQTADGQNFNVTKFGFYASEFKLTGPNGESYADKMEATAAQSLGYYKVLESNPLSKMIKLTNVPVGTYDKVTFTLGVNEAGIQSGAAGGVLDIANGGWFWNWNAGYIGYAVEGFASTSGQEFTGPILTGATAIHVGGWKEVPGNAMFTNNVRTVTLDLGTTIEVREDLSPEAHVVVDVKKFYDHSGIDFSTTYAVHSPSAGSAFADHAGHSFVLDHVHQ